MIVAALFGLIALVVVGTLTVLTTRLRAHVPAPVLRLRAVASLLDAVMSADPALVRRPDLLLTSYVHHIGVLLLDAATVWTMLRGVGLHAPPAPVFASFMVSSLARIVGISPGGIGTFEAASVATLHLVHVPVASALAATLLFRGLSFWIPLVPGLVLARREAR